jgi:hypothetical protein
VTARNLETLDNICSSKTPPSLMFESIMLGVGPIYVAFVDSP